MKYECFSSQLPNCTHLRTEVVQLNSGHITMTYVSTGGNLLRWMAKYNGKDTVGSRHIFIKSSKVARHLLVPTGLPEYRKSLLEDHKSMLEDRKSPQISPGKPQITIPRPQNTAIHRQNTAKHCKSVREDRKLPQITTNHRKSLLEDHKSMLEYRKSLSQDHRT